MATITELQYELSSLNSLKSDLSSLSAKIGYVSTDCSSVCKQLDNNYSLDNSVKAIQDINDVSGELSNYVTYINGTVIPSIDSRISSITTEISNLEAQQALENAADN